MFKTASTAPHSGSVVTARDPDSCLNITKQPLHPSERENNPQARKLFLGTYGTKVYRLFEVLVACDVLRGAH
jgi:hypothetical protein